MVSNGILAVTQGILQLYDAITRLGVNLAGIVWPTKRWLIVAVPVAGSYRGRIFSQEADRAWASSEEMTQSETVCEVSVE